MRKFYTAAAAAALTFGAQATLAQSSDFRGFRIEGQVGDDRFHSQDSHDDHFGYGAEVGFDGVIADKIVLGPDFTYWRGRAENVNTVTGGGVIRDKGFNELGAGLRAGYLLTPKILIFGTGGFARAENRIAYSGTPGTGGGAFSDEHHVDGYQLGGGVEYSLTKRFFVDAAYRYSDYDDHTHRARATLGAGVRF
jgi:outer membrane immunogenic protein